MDEYPNIMANQMYFSIIWDADETGRQVFTADELVQLRPGTMVLETLHLINFN